MSAVFSPCGTYRFRLDRQVGLSGRVFAWFGINPSKAGAVENDNTVAKWIGFTKEYRGSRFMVGNVSPFISRDVRRLTTTLVPLEIQRQNLEHITAMVAEADVLVPCWGDRKKVPRVMHNDIDQLLALLLSSGKPVKHLGLTKAGDPRHPLMLGYDTELEIFKP